MRDITKPLKRLLRLTKVHDESLRRRAAVLYVLLVATLLVLLLAFIVLLLSYIAGVERTPANRLLAVGGATCVAASLYILMRKGYYFIAAYGVLIIYGCMATIMAMQWSINLPSVSLLYSIVIVIAGMVLGAGYALSAAFIAAVLLFVIETAILHGTIRPNISWQHMAPNIFDLSVYYLVFIVLGVSSWLFNRQTDQALHHALRAEGALQREKRMLEIQVEARTHELQVAQLEKMEQLYRFAQLGQFSTSLLHDLGNHMSTLTLDVEGLAERHEHSQLQQRIKRRIGYIDNMVRWAYENINGKIQPKNFNVKRETHEVIKIFQYNARQANVQLHVMAPVGQTLRLYGDANRFRQLLANLISNAIDAYERAPEITKREVNIELSQGTDGALELTVRDFGPGITPKVQEKIFQPFYSTKYDGMGIGLFVVRQIAEEYFSGSISVVSGKGETRFTIILAGAAREQ